MATIYAGRQNHRVMPSLTKSRSHPQNNGSQLPMNRQLAGHPCLDCPPHEYGALAPTPITQAREPASQPLTAYARSAHITRPHSSAHRSGSLISLVVVDVISQRARDSLNHRAPRPSSTGMPIARTAPRARVVVDGGAGHRRGMRHVKESDSAMASVHRAGVRARVVNVRRRDIFWLAE
jgi:hypothetical protein